MLLQVLISELISNSASVFFHSWKTVSLLTYAIPSHTYAEVDFEVFFSACEYLNQYPVGYTIR